MCAVFIPSAFISGISGQFFRQFAVTIAASTVISCFVSLTLSPALCAILFKPACGARAGAIAARYWSARWSRSSTASTVRSSGCRTGSVHADGAADPGQRADAGRLLRR